MSLLAKKSFCSWLCPVGTLSEVVYKLGRKVFGHNFRIWLWLDLLLRGSKYLLLLLFLVFILIGMSGEKVVKFLDAPYWAVSDVKMLHFFTKMSGTTMVVLADSDLLVPLLQDVLVPLSLPLWCVVGPDKCRQPFQNPSGCDRLYRLPTLFRSLSFRSCGTFHQISFFTGVHRVPHLCGKLSGEKCARHAAGLLETTATGVGFSGSGSDSSLWQESAPEWSAGTGKAR